MGAFLFFEGKWQASQRRKNKSSECKFEKICIAVTLKSEDHKLRLAIYSLRFSVAWHTGKSPRQSTPLQGKV